MRNLLYKVIPQAVDEVIYDHWRLVDITDDIIEHTPCKYLEFRYSTIDGEEKQLIYSTFSDMIFGIEDANATIEDLDILISFIKLRLHYNDEFVAKCKEFILMECVLYPDYIYANILE